MPSMALLQRINSSTTTSATGDNHHHHLISKKPTSLPQNLIKQLSLQYPALLNPVPETLHNYHIHRVGPNQATSAVVHIIPVPISVVWSILRCFDNPLPYKRFLKSCHLVTQGGSQVGALREVRVVSGVPASFSTERLNILDDEQHVMGFSVIGGEHRLRNYRSVTTLHEVAETGTTVVVESYVVDLPAGNTREETCLFADTIVRCNMHALAQVARDVVTLQN